MSTDLINNDWKVSYAFQNIGSGSTPKSTNPEYFEGGNINWLITGDLNDGEIFETSKKITPKALADYSTLKTYPPNSLVVAMYGATIAKVGLLKISTTVNQACCVLVPSKRVLPKYAYYFFLASKQKLIDLGSGGGQPNISQDTIKNFRIRVPSVELQKQMSLYLDTKTENIDKAVKKKKELYKLLNERALAEKEFIFERSNLNKFQIKRCSTNVVQKVTVQPEIVGEANIIMLEDIESWTSKINKVSDNHAIAGDLIQFKEGDVLFSKLRPYLAKATLATKGGYCSGEFLVLRPNNKLDPEYLLHYILSKKFIDGINSATYGTKMPRASWGIVGNTEIPLPEIQEQRRIAIEISRVNLKLRKACDELEISISLLEEYRSSLIINVVAGKVKV